MIKKILTTCFALCAIGAVCAQSVGDTFTADDGNTYRIAKINPGTEAGNTSSTKIEWGGGNKSIITTTVNWSGTDSKEYEVELISLGSSTSTTINNWKINLDPTQMLGVGDSDNTYNYKDNATEYNKNVSKLNVSNGYFTLAQVKGMGVTDVFQNGANKNPNKLNDNYNKTVYYYSTYYDEEDDYLYETYYMITDIQVKKIVTGVKLNEINYVVKEFNANLINSSITSLTIGSSVTSITGNFGNAAGLKSITNKSDSYSVKNVEGDVYLYNAAETQLLYTSASNKTITLPASVTSIAPGAIINSQSLVIKASGITDNPALEGTNNILHKNEAIVNGNVVTGFINQTAFNAISFESGKSYDFTGAVIEGSIDATTAINAKKNLILFFAEGADVTADKNVVIGGTCSNLVLEDGVAYNNTIRKFEADQITYIRNFGIDEKEKGVWNATIVPFTINDINQFDVAKLISADASGFTVKQQTSVVQNTPYLIRSKADSNTKKAEVISSINITSRTDVYMSNGENSYNVDGGVEFTGVYNDFNDYEAGYRYYTYTSDGSFVFVRKGTLAVYSPFHAYIKVNESFFGSAPSSASIRFIDQFEEVIDENGVATGIEAIETVNVSNNAVYDLNGNAVVNPSAGKLYIQNGKKFIKK